MQIVTRRFIHLLVFLASAACAGLAHAGWDIEIIHYPGADFTVVGGINAAGQVIGAATFDVDTDPYSVSFIYDPKKGTFTDIPQPPGDNAAAFGINDSGIVVGNTDETTGGFILGKKGTYSMFSYPGKTFTQPRAVGNTGLVSGFAYDTGVLDRIGFIYDPARDTYTDVTVPGGLGVFPQGINGRGDVVGSVRLGPSSSTTHGFLRDRKGAIELFRVNDLPTSARGINDAQLVTGFVIDSFGVSRGFVAKLPGTSGVQAVSVADADLIEVPGATFFTSPQAIDNSGRVVGFWAGIDEFGADVEQGFIATPTK